MNQFSSFVVALRMLPVMLLAILLAGCPQLPSTLSLPPQSAPSRTELFVFAASSLTDAFDEIAVAFETANPGVDVVINYGSSSALAAQILEGSVVDVFASANARQIQNVAEQGLITVPPLIFATNQLMVIVPADNPAVITTLEDLARPGVKLILAVPGVPIRDYTDQMIAALDADSQIAAGYAEAVYANLVSEEENVRQVVAKIALGEADAGIVYTSDVTPDLIGQVLEIPVPAAYNVVATYPMAPLVDAPHPLLAQAFVDFVTSGAGQTILQRWGFGVTPQ